MPTRWFGVDRSTVTRATGEGRPLPAMRGCAVAPRRSAAYSRRSRRRSRCERAERDHRRHRDPGPPPGRRARGPGEIHRAKSGLASRSSSTRPVTAGSVG
ncbi:hypothetical protein ACGFY7_26155 [Streptomyces prunicolor]|uniref:hypothetical protein n=1 Tax=Streptomyces prunicolor TaxID=67348 RepID=UPI0037236E3B